ncbi:S8 family peptidase [Niallia sp. HCP3S3_B10]|uniref:S8 family peptidase n=1 Tax=unclassified Niallia TaxID=2837522 RepID=UPI00203B69E7|nr:S8 family peptidase [Niallia sp. MER TA 168]MCM3362547.1 S8 family peptidase [Niallia sp. MER TA 168]
MKKIIIIIICMLFTLSTITGTTLTFAKEGSKNDALKKEYIIAYQDSVDKELIKEVGGQTLQTFKYSPAVTASLTEQQVKRLKEKKVVVEIEQNEKVFAAEDIDKKSSSQVNESTYPNWNLKQTGINKIHKKGIKGEGIKIGVIDSGINSNHSDLKVYGGFNVLDNNGSYEDDYGHGTRVAGIIAALDNNVGIKGVAPEAKLYSIKALDSKGEGMISDIISGIEWAIENDMDIINLSLQTTTENNLLKKTINKAINKGIIVVAAAGNKGSVESGSTLTYPAKYKNVISVGALTKKKERADFSSVGRNLDLMAPGEFVYTTFDDGYFVAFSGTSIATPHVTGTAALMLSVNPNMSQLQIEEILKKTSTPIGERRLYGSGLLNANKAINLSKKKK